MTVAQALWLGVLQGATEFLPVSSSGHLALAESLLPGGQEPELLFDLLLHLATLLAIAVILRRRILDLALAGLSVLGGQASEARRTDRRWLGLLVVASVPTAILGLTLREIVGEARGQPVWVGVSLLVTAALLVLAERVGRRDRNSADLGVGDAMVIGAVQGLAVMPGISRSGSTIAAALCRNSRAETAVEFSMLVFFPAIIGANLLEVWGGGARVGGAEVIPFLTGFVAAFITGALSLKALQWLVLRRRLFPFAIYCVAVGLGAIALG